MTHRFRSLLPQTHRARRVLVGIGLIAGWLIASALVNYRLTHRSRSRFDEPPPKIAWGTLIPERIDTTDGESLGAWYAEGSESGPSVLVLHGNGGSRWNVLSRAAIFAARLEASVLMVSLRAHGDSTGKLNDIGYSARRDVAAAVDWLRQRRPGKPVLVLGVSMGSAAAIFAGGELGDWVQGYVLESPYRDLTTAVWNRTHAYLPPILSEAAYLGLRLTAPLVLPDFQAIAPIKAIGKIPEAVPILILAGGRDRLATVEEARALVERVKTHARLEVFPEAGHPGLLEVDPERYAKLLVDFAEQATGSRGVEPKN